MKHVPVSAKAHQWLAPALIAALISCASCAQVQPPRPAPAGVVEQGAPFIVTFWCGPPYEALTDARAAEIAAAGFNVIGAPCEGRFDEKLALRAMDTAARHGLRVWLRDPRFGEGATRKASWRNALRQAVAAYRHHPALHGYFVDDEPWGDEVQEAAEILAELRRADPTHFGYVNLLPDYAFEEKDRAQTYASYVRGFVEAASPALLSFDYYAFGEKKDRSTFFRNLATVREISREAGVPFLFIGLAMPHGPYRTPTYGELSWQMYHALAYGARGISYFAYWTPVQVEHRDRMRFRYGLIENGRRTETYYHAAQLNREITAVAAELRGTVSFTVADTDGVIAPKPTARLPVEVHGGPVTLGEFAAQDGRRAVLLVNRDYRYSTAVAIRPARGTQTVEAFDTASRSWNDAPGTLVLPPGGAVLVRPRPQAGADEASDDGGQRATTRPVSSSRGDRFVRALVSDRPEKR